MFRNRKLWEIAAGLEELMKVVLGLVKYGYACLVLAFAMSIAACDSSTNKTEIELVAEPAQLPRGIEVAERQCIRPLFSHLSCVKTSKNFKALQIFEPREDLHVSQRRRSLFR